jgi:hypothetical protein
MNKPADDDPKSGVPSEFPPIVYSDMCCASVRWASKPLTPEEIKEMREWTDRPPFLRIPPYDDYVAPEDTKPLDQ